MELLDVCSTEQLKERARRNGKDERHVPEIDFLYDFSRSISDCVDSRKYEFVVSSHVIEHVPDLIRHFQEVQEVLQDDGTYVFLAPDKEMCFDALKPSSSLGQVIEAHIENRKAAPVSALIDEYRYGVKRGGKGAWSRGESGPHCPKYENATKLIVDVIRNPKIAANWHGHIWRFTIAEFGALISELRTLGFIDLELVAVVPTNSMEFIAVLEKKV